MKKSDKPQVMTRLGLIVRLPIKLMESSNLNMMHHNKNYCVKIMTNYALQTDGK